MHALPEAELSGDELDELIGDLRYLSQQMRALLGSSRDAARPVDLDQPIGRLSRMDAMQQQSMLKANRESARLRLERADAALRRHAEGEYGACIGCGECVGFRRLKAQPEAPLCIACQSSREAQARG